MLKALGIHSLNIVSLMVFIILFNVEHSTKFLENYKMTALALAGLFVMSFVLSMISACANQYASGILSLFFSFLTNMIIAIACFGTISHIEAVWFFIIMSGIIFPLDTLVAWHDGQAEGVASDDVSSEIDKTTESPLVTTANEEVRFAYAEFDMAFEELKGKWDFLQQNVVLLGAEKVHKAETLLNDLSKVRSIYSTISEKKQEEANGLVQSLLDEAHTYFENLRSELDEGKVKQIEKFVMKYKEGSVC